MSTPSGKNDGATLRAVARAVELQQKGRLDDAEAAYARLIAQDDTDPTVLINAGVLALARTDVATALARLARAVGIVPSNAVAHGNLGYALIRAGRFGDALASLDRAVALKPDFAHAHNNRGIALMRLKRRGDARRAFERALELLPGYPEAALNLGEAANQAGDSGIARSAYARVLAKDPREPIALAGVAFADALEGRLDEACSALDSAVRDAPKLAAAWQTLGAVRNWSWRHDEAEVAYRRALELDPTNRDAQFGIASTLLARGRYPEGFAAFESSRAPDTGLVPQMRALPVWNGEPLSGTLVLHGEQGLGDVIQFVRFLPELRPRISRLVFLLDGYWAPLAPLLAPLAGVDRVVTDTKDLHDEAPRARCSVLSLAHLAEATTQTLPRPPYLHAPGDRSEAWRARLGSSSVPRVGLAWSVFARDDHGFVTRHKSIPPQLLTPLLDVAGVEFHSIQPGAAGDPAAFGALADRVAGYGTAIRDFADTAALLSELDLVIAPDTAVAHLAGALGTPIWLLERMHGCWRWRLEDEVSPWYPTLRIFRQSRFNDWSRPDCAGCRRAIIVAMKRSSAFDSVIDDLVAANRILAGHGVLDGFGHVSARHPHQPDRYLLSRSLAPALVTASDIVAYDLDSQPVDGDDRRPYLERFIHGGIYRRRADVMAIVHSHSPSVIPYTASSVPLRPLYHMASFLGGRAPVFEIRERFGTTDMLIRDSAQGDALAESLGGHAVLLMRGHGFCTVGESLPVAVFRAIYTEINSALQREAIALGGTVTYLDEDEARLSEATNRSVVARPWELWKARFAPRT